MGDRCGLRWQLGRGRAENHEVGGSTVVYGGRSWTAGVRNPVVCFYGSNDMLS